MRRNDDSAKQDARLDRLELELGRAHAKIAEQTARLAALTRGREESMQLLDEARAELGRVAAERDRLQRRLVAVEGMQTETVALPEDDAVEAEERAALPSIDELMVSLNAALEDGEVGVRRSRLGDQGIEQADGDWNEMIAPELMAPDEFGERQGSTGAAGALPAPRFLVYMDANHPISYPLLEETMTIGRSESADIQIFGAFVSRIHARVHCGRDSVTIEDAGSKNGFKVNSQRVARHALRHGDVIAIGKLRFTFVDPGR